MAITARIFFQIILMHRFRWPKRFQRLHFDGDWCAISLLLLGNKGFNSGKISAITIVDAGALLRSNIAPLLIKGEWVDHAKEML